MDCRGQLGLDCPYICYQSHTHARFRRVPPPLPFHIREAGNETEIRSKVGAQKAVAGTRLSSPRQHVLNTCVQYSDLKSVSNCPFVPILYIDNTHFYLTHRFLRWNWVYKYVHSVHHRNVIVGPLVRHLGAPDRKRHIPEPAPHLFISVVDPPHVIIHIAWLSIGHVGPHCGSAALIIKGKE